jgi:hypothetical protein
MLLEKTVKSLVDLDHLKHQCNKGMHSISSNLQPINHSTRS